MKFISTAIEPDSVRANARSEHRATRPSGQANLRCLEQSRVSAFAGPSHRFLALTRNPRLEPPSRFEPTTKGENDVVI